ncbi:GNAT family acetyltransferase [Legionella gratiana]|uniref:GNAT family acetyltransferase n=1 Tax=Legionella gratiana TaxID=45066 RepID=A0A378J7I0_9GAMM|nr:GNAT family protein [Legionella gratiana]KTD06130.1 GNAT family acetyltransferase [Legionella gratiana]STX42921.1 GNAT family acetyltransferase [Legionella gratiana]
MSSKIHISESDILKGSIIHLEPISLRHREGLSKAADDEQIWKYMPQNATKKFFDSWFNSCLDKMVTGEQIIYAVRCKANQAIVGATAYYGIQLENKSLVIGYSWYTPNLWGSKVNPEAKLLMLTQAFECWGINRVELGTDSRNIRSYNAIKKLGATEEGLLRQHMILQDKVITDTIIFSILRSEWPDIKMGLINRL